MTKLDVVWQKGKGKEEDFIVVSKRPTRKGSTGIGPFQIPARIFDEMTREGTKLLRENHYGTFFEPEEISLEFKKARSEDNGQIIVNVYVNDHFLIQFWCDKITKWSPMDYTFELKGQNISGIGAKNVKIAPELKDYIWMEPKVKEKP